MRIILNPEYVQHGDRTYTKEFIWFPKKLVNLKTGLQEIRFLESCYVTRIYVVDYDWIDNFPPGLNLGWNEFWEMN